MYYCAIFAIVYYHTCFGTSGGYFLQDLFNSRVNPGFIKFEFYYSFCILLAQK